MPKTNLPSVDDSTIVFMIYRLYQLLDLVTVANYTDMLFKDILDDGPDRGMK